MTYSNYRQCALCGGRSPYTEVCSACELIKKYDKQISELYEERSRLQQQLLSEREGHRKTIDERWQAICLLRRMRDGYPSEYRGTYWEDAVCFLNKLTELPQVADPCKHSPMDIVYRCKPCVDESLEALKADKHKLRDAVLRLTQHSAVLLELDVIAWLTELLHEVKP